MSTIKQLQEEIIPNVVRAVRSSTGLKANDIAFHRTIEPELANQAKVTSNRLINIANEIIDSISTDHEQLRIENDEELKGSNWKKVSDTVDTLFERVDVLMDEINSGRSSNSQVDDLTYLESSSNVTKDDSRALAKRMEKPQLRFKAPVDNTEATPFKPRLKSKPNNLRSFEESMQLIQPGKSSNTDYDRVDPPYYPHPYEYEIDNQPYPDSILHEGDVIPSKPFDSTTVEWIDKPEQIDNLIKELSRLTEIAVDLEHHDYRSYYGLVCLMQISNREKDWIVDTLALRDDLQKLNVVFTNPDIVKVFHGAFMDIIWLQRDLGLYVVSLFDTYHASKKLGFPRFSLAYLLETFARFKTSKKYQLADWRIRPLLSSMLAYAKSDTHFLLSIFDQLKNKLIQANNNKLQEVLYESRQVAKRRFEFTKFRPLPGSGSNLVTCPVMASNPDEPYLPIVSQYNIPYHIRPVVEMLYNWRDQMAKELDESVRYVMPNQALALLATLSRPVDAKKVLSIPTFVLEPIRDHCQELAEMINETLNKLEAKDWELTNKSSSLENNLSNHVEPDLDSISLKNQIFDQIYKENMDLLKNSPIEKLSRASIIFDVPLDYLGVCFNNKGYRKVPLRDLSSRLTLRNRGFEKLNNMKPLPDSPPALISKTNEADELNLKELEPENKEEKKAEDKNEIISLRKPKKQKKNNKRSHSKVDETPFDYNNTNNLLRSNPGEKSSKRKKSFNPYSNSGSGPKPAKQPRNIRSGKSGTFKR